MLKNLFTGRTDRRAADYAARANALAAAHVAPEVNLTDPAAHVEIVLVLQAMKRLGGPTLDMNPASALNFAFENARGVWDMTAEGCERLVVSGPAAEVAAWIKAYNA